MTCTCTAKRPGSIERLFPLSVRNPSPAAEMATAIQILARFFCPMKSPSTGTRTTYIAVMNDALCTSVYLRPYCWKVSAAMRHAPTAMEPFMRSDLLLFLIALPPFILILEAIMITGSRKSAPMSVRKKLKVKGDT